MVSPVNRGNIGIVQQMGEVGRMGYNQMGNIGQNFGGQQQIHQTQYGGIQSGNWNSNCWNMSPIQAQQVCNMNALQTQPYYPSQQQQLTSNNQGYQNNGLTIPTYPQTNNYPLVNNAYPYNNSLATGCPAATMLPTMTAMTSLSCLPIYDPSIPIIPERLSRPQISLIKAVAQ